MRLNAIPFRSGIAALIAACLLPAIALAQPAQKPPGDDIARMRAWVAEGEERDFDFWRRYLNRLDLKGVQFPQPKSWYRPAEIIEGAESAPWPRLAPEKRTLAPAALAQVRSYAMARKTGALMIARHGVIEFESYDDGLGPASLLASRSLAKLVLSMMFGIAEEKGMIGSIDDPVGRYVEEWRADERGAVTLRQLLGFTSGIETVSMSDYVPNSKAVRLTEGSRVNQAALAYARAAAPDTIMTVNNADSQVAGLALERATGRRYADLVSEWLWKPMGGGAATVNLDKADGDARIFCCMLARSVDWLRLGQLLLDNGRMGVTQILPAAYVARMRAAGPVNPLVGLATLRGWHLNDDPGLRKFLIIPQQEPFRSPGLYYALGGRSITLWIDPANEMVVFRWGDDVTDWDNAVIMNRLDAALRH